MGDEEAVTPVAAESMLGYHPCRLEAQYCRGGIPTSTPQQEAVTPVAAESMLGYHPCSTGLLTCSRDPAGGQCLVGSLTGAVASERVSEALKGSLRMVGNHSKSAKAEGSLTATPTGGAGTKVGLSDPVV